MCPATAATPTEDGRAPVERLQNWRATNLGSATWYTIEVALVAGLYYGAGRAGLGRVWPMTTQDCWPKRARAS